MFGVPSLFFRLRSCTRWLKAKMTRWQSFEKCYTKASLDNFMYVRVTERGNTRVGSVSFSVTFLSLCSQSPEVIACCSCDWFLLSSQTSDSTSQAQQQVALLDLQSALFCSQLEIQKLQRSVRQKERQLADAKRCVQLVETTAQEREKQKEASWKHNQVNH